MMSLTYQAATQEPLLVVEQERIAIRKWQEEGDQGSLELLIVSHARQVWAQAISWASNPVHIEDLVAEGIIGLMRAADNFDLKFKVRFSTYAMWWISASISAALARIKVVIDIPARIYVEASRGRLQGDRSVSAQMAIQDAIPIEAKANDKDYFVSIALQSPEPNPEELAIAKSSSKALSRTLSNALEVLNPTERKIIRRLKLRYSPDCASKLAKEMNISQTKLRQIERHALMRLKKELPKCGFQLEMLS